MRRYLAVAALLLLCLALLSGSACARDWFVATNGNDSTGDGTISNPYATPQTAFTQTQPGDTVQIRSGTYTGGITVWGGGYKSGAPGSPITVRAYDGYLTAHIGRLALQPVSYLNFEGLDVAMSDVQPINLCGIETSWRVYNRCHHMQFRHCKFTLTDTDGVQGADELFKCRADRLPARGGLRTDGGERDVRQGERGPGLRLRELRHHAPRLRP